MSTSPPAPSRPSRIGVDLTAVAALDAIFVVGILWYRSGGVDALVEPASALGSVARLLGLSASNLLLMQVLLMARIPWLERHVGQDRLVVGHRRLGSWSVCLMLAHVVLIAVSRASMTGADLLSGFWQLVTSGPAMLLAFVAMSLLVIVAGTSIRAARRRLPYQRWHLLHLYAYVGVGLAVPHQLLVGTSFATSTAAVVYWWSLYLLAVGSVLTFRIGLPVVRSWRHRIVVERVVPEAAGVVSLHLTGRGLDRLPIRAGQFFFWRFLGGRGGLRANPFSLSAAPRADRLRITVRTVGDGSRRVAELRPGTRVLVEGPFGTVTSARRTGRPVLLVAAGIGITPMRSMIDELGADLPRTTLLYRVPDRSAAVFAGELDAIVGRGLRLHYLEGERATAGWLPADTRGSELDVLDSLVPGIVEHEAFLCGPPAWMALVRSSLVRAGLPDRRIHAEEFGW